MEKLFGRTTVQQAIETVSGKNKFLGLTKTDLNLTGIIRHQKLIESYKKLQKAKGK
jgi:ribosomal protein S12 methylthiotransferase accessory factor